MIITNIFIALMLVTGLAGYDIAHTPVVEEVMASEPTNTPVASPVALQAPETPESYIISVFGEYAPKAFLLLNGNDECGGENKQLNTFAVNVNDSGSRDRGIFQINDKYHPLTDAQAFDFKQNIDYAHRMFVNDDFTFVRWTAGRCLSI